MPSPRSSHRCTAWAISFEAKSQPDAGIFPPARTFCAPSPSHSTASRCLSWAKTLPNPGHPVGLSFCVAPDVQPIPRSLTNIYKELTDDLGVPMPTNGDLTPWTNQGVMLLNRCLTVEAGKPGSHQDKGWEIVTDAAIKALNNRRNPDGSIKPLVAILWGRKAQMLGPLLTNAYIIASPHPSPMSARYGFFGSKPFSRANQALIAAGEKPVDWSLPSA